jgi:hypothetical protein
LIVMDFLFVDARSLLLLLVFLFNFSCNVFDFFSISILTFGSTILSYFRIQIFVILILINPLIYHIFLVSLAHF